MVHWVNRFTISCRADLISKYVIFPFGRQVNICHTGEPRPRNKHLADNPVKQVRTFTIVLRLGVEMALSSDDDDDGDDGNKIS